ncbi:MULTISPECIES: tetratricopeptide repeat protein [unclassified Bradyrhizobium]|uniref:tetratricopeptide repeat protein n=1 Tax=unclassified Bradyrhizobium TaxID=2631580 RepID=UPI002915E8E5|nr:MULTISPECIES: tetratricopeptide repeat protein [unclassified Bradyrhizobium]
MQMKTRSATFSLLLALIVAGACTLTALAQQVDIDTTLKAFNEFYARGNFAAAEREAQTLERTIKTRFGTDNTNYANALNNLANTHQAQGRYDEAESELTRTLNIQ